MDAGLVQESLSHGRPGEGWKLLPWRRVPLRWGECVLVLVLVWAGVWLTSLLMLGHLSEFHEEGGPLELSQSALLGMAVVLSVLATLRIRPGPTRAWGGLLSLLALAAFAREADFHTVLNPKYMGEWGIRYRADWWLSAKVSFLLKAGWVLALATPVVVVGYLYHKSHVDPLGALRRRTPFVRLAVLCLCLYALGYAMDDLLGRGQFVPTWITMIVEEVSELGAAAVVLVMCLPISAELLPLADPGGEALAVSEGVKVVGVG